jgi:hypothetical protein
MRLSLVATTGLLVASAAAAVGASTSIDLNGNNRVLAGSDTLDPLVQQVLANCPGAVPGHTAPDSTGNSTDGTYYVGGGSGVGAAAMQANTQQIGAASSALKTTNYCGVSIDSDGNGTVDLAIQGTTEALLLGLDGVSVVANKNEAAEPNSIAISTSPPKTITVHHYIQQQDPSTTFTKLIWVVDPNTDPATAYGATLNADHTATYTINSSVDVLRLIYGGFHHDTGNAGGGTFNCGSDVRRSLADSWGTLFTGAVPNPTRKLSHAWRRGDTSGTTDAFVALVGFGSRGVGPAFGGASSSRKTNPFCNAKDQLGPVSNPTGINSTIVSFGGPGDFADFDPIRRPAVIGPDPATSTTKDLEQVAQNDGSLGLVVPIFYPDTPGIATTQTYPTRTCSTGKFDLIDTGNSGEVCPEGPNFLGLCFEPYFQANAADSHHYNCLSKSNSAAFGAPDVFDGRTFNLPVRDDTTGRYVLDFNHRELTQSYYRIHTTTSTTLASAGVDCTAKEITSTFQIAHLTICDPNSIGYCGRGVESDPSLGPSVTELSVSGSSPNFDPTVAIAPTDANVRNLVANPSGTVYPLARRLYLNTLVGFSANATPSDGGPAVRGLQGEELELARCFQNSDHVGAAMLNNGFVPMPSAAQGFAPNGVIALDYPETAPTTPTNLTLQPLPGCAAASNRDATVVSPPDRLTQYSLTTNPPFPYPWP